MARDRDRDCDREDSEFVDKLVHINRVAKVVKGGRRFGFAALVVIGDQKGRVGYGHGKAREVPEAIRKATEKAKKTMIRVPLREGRTLHHDVRGRFGAGKVVLRAAPAGGLLRGLDRMRHGLAGVASALESVDVSGGCNAGARRATRVFHELYPGLQAELALFDRVTLDALESLERLYAATAAGVAPPPAMEAYAADRLDRVAEDALFVRYRRAVVQRH